MKTEKRLTMALSVLVALMMLAVPLASSSNLFVDGGQTNSNGDAPSLGANEAVEIVEVWIINDQTSLNKIGSYLTPEIQNSKYTDLWDDECIADGPWIAVAFKALTDGDATVTVENQNMETGHTFSKTISNCEKNKTYVVTAYLDGKVTNGTLPSGFPVADQGDIDALLITDENKFYTDDYTVKAKVGADSVEAIYTMNYNDLGKSYDVSFNLNDVNESGKKSLDEVLVKGLGTTAGISWYVDENNIYHAIVNSSITVEQLVSIISNAVSKAGYTLDSWKDADGNVYSTSAVGTTAVKKDMSFSAVWLLKDGYKEVPVNVVFGDQTTEYVKAYELTGANDDKVKVVYNDLTRSIKTIAKLNLNGIVVNSGDTPAIKPIYSDAKLTYGDKTIESGKDATISADSTLTATYTFNDREYSKITVHSDAFKDGKDVILYALKNADYTYNQIFKALQHPATETDGIKAAIALKNGGNLDNDKNATTSDNYYLLTGWNNGAELLDSARYAPNELTLDSKLNGYYVVFMSKGQYEIVYVPYGELSAGKCTLDTSGLNHWVWMSYDDYSKSNFNGIQSFNFNQSQISVIEKLNNDHKTPVAVFITCFTPSSSTSYAVFDAGEANFGNEYVDKIIIPGKINENIPLPANTPAFGDEDNKLLFIGWQYDEVKYSSEDKYSETVKTYTPITQKYNYKVVFYNGSDAVGTFYYTGAPTSTDITANLVAFEADGVAYRCADYRNSSGELVLSNDSPAKKAYDGIIYTTKAGYDLKQWNDADGNAMITISSKIVNGKTVYSVDKVNTKELKSDMSLYANFEPKKFNIVYNSGTGLDPVTQEGKVGETVELYGDAFFTNDGKKLLSWNTRPDGNGTSYALGASLTLSGEQYEELNVVDGVPTLTLYAVWEGGSSTPGDNTDGGNDNTALYLIAGMLAIIAILAIVGILLMRKK